MKKVTALFYIFFFGLCQNPSYAQYSQDRQLLIQERLRQVCVKKPIINLEYKAADMPVYSNIPYKELSAKSNSHAKFYGLYTNQFGLKTQYKIGQYSIENQSCFYVSEINITVEINPTIYVANEAAQFPCIREKVYAHELKHHQHFMNAINAEHSSLYNEIKQQLLNLPSKYHQSGVQELTILIKNKVENIQKVFSTKINNRKEPYDKHLDNPINTEKDLSQCKNELYYLNRLYR